MESWKQKQNLTQLNLSDPQPFTMVVQHQSTFDPPQ